MYYWLLLNWVDYKWASSSNRCYTRPNFFLRSSRIRINLLSCESKTTDKRQQNAWRAKKNLDRQDNDCETYGTNIYVIACPVVGNNFFKLNHPSNFFSAISYFSQLPVSLLSFNSRSTLIRLNKRKKSERATHFRCILQDRDFLGQDDAELSYYPSNFSSHPVV